LRSGYLGGCWGRAGLFFSRLWQGFKACLKGFWRVGGGGMSWYWWNAKAREKQAGGALRRWRTPRSRSDGAMNLPEAAKAASPMQARAVHLCHRCPGRWRVGGRPRCPKRAISMYGRGGMEDRKTHFRSGRRHWPARHGLRRRPAGDSQTYLALGTRTPIPRRRLSVTSHRVWCQGWVLGSRVHNLYIGCEPVNP